MSPIDKKREDLVLVLDTTAISSGFSLHIVNAKQFTTPNVLGELSSDRVGSVTRSPLLNESSIEIVTPDDDFLRKIDEAVDCAGEKSVSPTDKSLLALALQLRHRGYVPLLVTDDYAVQNMSRILHIDYLPYIEKGIRKRYTWTLMCPACFRKYPASPELGVCLVCGTRLKRKAGTTKKAG